MIAVRPSLSSLVLGYRSLSLEFVAPSNFPTNCKCSASARKQGSLPKTRFTHVPQSLDTPARGNRDQPRRMRSD